MSTVLKVKPWERDGKTRYFIDLDDGGTKVECVSFSEKAAALEIDKPLPDGWVLEAPKEEGWKPMLKAPREPGRGGGGGFKGRSPEMESFIQERMDRRTALMQAMTACGDTALEGWQPNDDIIPRWELVADHMYTWLRQTANMPAVEAPSAGKPGDGNPSSQSRPSPSSGTTSVDSHRGEPTEERAGLGQDSEGEAGSCPPHQPNRDVAPKNFRYPCKKCGAWVKP